MAGPPDKKAKFDFIWCEVDKTHYLIQRQDHDPLAPGWDLDRHFSNLAGVARGTASTLAGYNAFGDEKLKELQKIGEEIQYRRAERYYSFLDIPILIKNGARYALLDKHYLENPLPGHDNLIEMELDGIIYAAKEI